MSTLPLVHTVNVSKTNRLDKELVRRGLVATRSQAEDIIRREFVKVDGRIITKAGHNVAENADITVRKHETFVSRAGEKLNSVIDSLKLNFRGKVILDVGSSTGGFTDLALKNAATKVIAVDVGTNQLHPDLRNHPSIELHEKTDIRDFKTTEKIDMVLMDVSFISLREVLPAVVKLCQPHTQIIAMAKPQFEVGDNYKHKGVIKNEKVRRQVLTELESWIKNVFVIVDKADAGVIGTKGNKERFYLLRPIGR